MKIAVCLSALLAVGLAGKCDKYFDELAAKGSEQDVCHTPFSQFTNCAVGEIEDNIDTIIEGSSPAAQDEAKTCFSDSGCDVSYDENDALDTLLPCPYGKESSKRKDECIWRYAADKIIEMLQKSPDDVNVCMIRYFKSVGAEKIEECVAEYGEDVEDFHQSEIPGFEDFELDDLKNVLIYHVMTRYHLAKCADCSTSTKPGLVGCLAQQAKDSDKAACDSRAECESLIGNGDCWDRFQDVRTSVCECAKAGLKKGLAKAFSKGAFKKAFVRGDWRCQLQKCYEDSGNAQLWEDEMSGLVDDAVRSAVKAFVAMTTGSAPKQMKEVLYVLKTILDEAIDKWGGVLCGECNPNQQPAKYYREKSFKNLLSSPTCKDQTELFQFEEDEWSFSSESNSGSSGEDFANDFFGGSK